MTIACQYIVGACGRRDILLSSPSPRKCSNPLFCLLLSRPARFSQVSLPLLLRWGWFSPYCKYPTRTQKSEKPRIRLGYTVRSPSRSAFSKAPRKLLLVDFGRKEYGYQTSWRRFVGGGGSTVLQEPYLNSTLGFATKKRHEHKVFKNFKRNPLSQSTRCC